MPDQERPTQTTTPTEVSLPEVAPEGNLPATVGEDTPAVADGGLEYTNATAEEKARMDNIIASIDLLNTDTVTTLGGDERQKLADLADELLDSFKPDLKLAFAEAFQALIESLKANSIENVKKRSAMSGFKKAMKMLWCALTGKDYRVTIGKKQIETFMDDVTDSRQTIEEVADKLGDQKDELKKNWTRINELGAAVTKAAQDMRVVRAATKEYIRRADAGEIEQIQQLQEAAQSGRAIDNQKLQEANALLGTLKVIDGDLLASIGVYEMNVANLAFTKQANIQNRTKTDYALTSSIAEWKTQLALFGTVLTERTAQQMLNNVAELTEKSVQANSDLFDELVDAHIEGAAQGMHNLKAIAEKQEAMTAKLEEIGPAVEAQFNELAKDKEALEAASAKFREDAAKIFSAPNGAGAAPSAGPSQAPRPGA